MNQNKVNVVRSPWLRIDFFKKIALYNAELPLVGPAGQLSDCYLEDLMKFSDFGIS